MNKKNKKQLDQLFLSYLNITNIRDIITIVAKSILLDIVLILPILNTYISIYSYLLSYGFQNDINIISIEEVCMIPNHIILLLIKAKKKNRDG